MKRTAIARAAIAAAGILFCFFGVRPAGAQDTARNYSDCLSGRPTCDPSLLTTAQAQATIASLLGKRVSTPPALNEIQEVAQAEHDNNLRNCEIGAYCNKSLLVGNETGIVAQAEHDNNLRNCKIGAYCNKSLLSGADLTEPVPSSGPDLNPPVANGYSRSKTAAADAVPIAPPGVAENGSYYGELNANGVPKTVHVDGYTRKDGTYVRGYYRSPPYSNPPKIK